MKLFISTMMLCLLFASTAFCQNDKKGTFKIGQCRTMVAGKVNKQCPNGSECHDYDTLSVKELISKPFLQPYPCSEDTITSFELVTSANGITYTYRSNSNKLTDGMLSILKKIGNNIVVIIQNVHIKTTEGTNEQIPGNVMIVQIGKQ